MDMRTGSIVLAAFSTSVFSRPEIPKWLPPSQAGPRPLYALSLHAWQIYVRRINRSL